MKSNDFIKYIGIEAKPHIHTPYFTRVVCNASLKLPNTVPLIKELASVSAKPTVSTAEKILIKATDDTMVAKALIGGHIHLSFQYATPDPRYALYFGNHYLHFAEYLSLPEDLSPTVTLFPTVYIEDIFSHMVDSTTVYHNVILLILIDFG
ncbi:MAG: hypothetical protein ACRDDX_03145 [Cellulosilyticaceae bacterium]